MEKRPFLHHRTDFFELSFVEKRVLFQNSPSSVPGLSSFDTDAEVQKQLNELKTTVDPYKKKFIEYNAPAYSRGEHQERSQEMQTALNHADRQFSQTKNETIQELRERQKGFSDIISENGQIKNKDNINIKRFGIDIVHGEITNPNLLTWIREETGLNFNSDQAYLHFMQMKGIISASKEEENINHIVQELARYSNWIEKKLWLNGVPKPNDANVRKKLRYAVTFGHGNILALEKHLSYLTQTGKNEEFYRFVGKGGIGFSNSYYDQIEKYLGKNFLNSLNIAQAHIEAEKSQTIKLAAEEIFSKEYKKNPNLMTYFWRINGKKPPLENWFNTDGTPSTALTSSPLYTRYNDAKNPDFWKSLHGYIKSDVDVRTKLNLRNIATGSQEYAQDIRDNPSKVMDVLENFGDEVMDGNPVYIGALVATLFLANKNPKLRNTLFAVAGVGFANKVVDDATGVNLLDEGMKLIRDTSDMEKKNISTYTMREMKDAKFLENSDYSETEFSKAATFMGQENFDCIAPWYQGCKEREIKAGNTFQNTKKAEIYAEGLPDYMARNLTNIFPGLRSNIPKEAKAKVYFDFFENFLKHTDKKRNKSDIPSAENGLQYITTQYSKGIATEQGKKRSLRMEEIFNMEISPDTLRDVAAENMPIIQKISELGNGAVDYFKGNYEAMFGKIELGEAASRFYKWIRGMAYIGVPVRFVERNGKKVIEIYKKEGVWGVIDAGTNGMWNAKIGGYSMHTTFDKMMIWVEKQAQAAKKYTEETFISLNASLLGIDKPTLSSSIDLTTSEATIDALKKWGVTKEISELYGFARPNDLETFLLHEWATVLSAIQKISGKTNGFTKKDILQFFVGPAYFAALPAAGLTKGLQSIHEFMSASMQAVAPFDSVENMYEAITIRTDNDPKKYIAGRKLMNKAIEKTRTTNEDTEISWTIDDIQRVKDLYRARKRGILINEWRSIKATDIDEALNEFLYTVMRKDKSAKILDQLRQEKKAVNTKTPGSITDIRPTIKEFGLALDNEFVSFARAWENRNFTAAQKYDLKNSSTPNTVRPNPKYSPF